MKCFVRVAAAFLLAVTLPTAAIAQTYQATDFRYETYREVRTNGNDSTYSQGLTHRYVNGELRFLSLAYQCEIRIENGNCAEGSPKSNSLLQEFRLPAAGGVQTTVTGEWDLKNSGAFLHGFHGIWFEQARNRLWITSAEDYTATSHPARITLIDLRTDGSVRVLKQFFLDVPAKRVYGGCNAVPAALITQLGGPYVCGWGGYTSLVMQGGNASIGPTMYAIPDPDTIANGATVHARTVLDAANAQTNRGVRATLPRNYFDGGDPRQNPSSRPTGAPLAGASWLSPNGSGLGWMVWGDSYYNTGFWIGTTYGAIASLCEGACWYQDSTLAFDGRQFELHTWDGSQLGTNRLQRPSTMVELNVPIDPSRTPASGKQGNVTKDNLAGATYDPVSGRLYVIGFAMSDAYTARIYSYRVGAATGVVPTGVTPTAPSSQNVSTSSCTSIRPGPDWNCYNGGWLPPGMPIPGQSTPAPTPTKPSSLLPSLPSLLGSLLPCLSIKPGDGWNCYNGGWLPPGMPVPSYIPSAPVQAPTVSAPAPSSTPSGCSSVQPGILWVCRNGNWLPPFHPDR